MVDLAVIDVSVEEDAIPDLGRLKIALIHNLEELETFNHVSLLRVALHQRVVRNHVCATGGTVHVFQSLPGLIILVG